MADQYGERRVSIKTALKNLVPPTPRRQTRQLINRVLATAAPWQRRWDVRRALARSGTAVDSQQPRTATLLMVYRGRNAHLVEALLTSEDLGWCEIRLWSLDDVPERLRAWTVGSGQGAKFELLNGLLRNSDAGRYLVIADDDIVMKRGDLRELVAIGSRAGFDLFGATHARHSFWSHWITKRDPLSIARETTFVENGPLFVISPKRRSAFFPFPDDIHMGWGLELEWFAASRRGCRLGLIDSVSIVHLAAAGTRYDLTEERERIARFENQVGASLSEIERTVYKWGRWRRAF